LKAFRRVSELLLALLFLEVLSALITGGGSRFGFALRLAALAVLLTLRLSGSRLVLLLMLLPTLFQFQFAGGRLGGDGVMYYVYVRSLMKDGDLDFANEYRHYGLLDRGDRGDLAMPTSTGLRRSIFSIGPGLLAIPGFALGEAAARGLAALGMPADSSGYGPTHRNAVALGGLLYGFGALLLVHSLLRRHFRESTALLATLALWGTTFLHWYMVQQPAMSHAPSAFCAALVLLLWDRSRGELTARRAGVLGLVLGLAMCVRWQNGVLLLLPGFDLLGRLRRAPRQAARSALALGLGALLGAIPQLLAWKAIYGEYLLRYPPHGADFLRLDHPFLLETFFSSRHGLLYWSPSLWAAYLGFLPLFARRRRLAAALSVPLLAMSYVNACSGDWWAGGSFSNRRFDSLLPIFGFGFAAAIDVLRGMLAARAGAALLLAGLPFVAWNVALAEQTQRGLIPRDDTVAFSRLAGNAARVVSEAAGSPVSWPASWIFAWRSGLPAGRYDLSVGRYLFYRQNKLGGTILPADPGHASLLAEGWGRVVDVDGTPSRTVAERARLLAPLDVAEPLEVRLQLRARAGPAQVRLLVNGREAGRLVVLGDSWQELRVAVPEAYWRRELNDVVIQTSSDVAVAAVRFAQSGRP
jgi:hypothetical protein